MKPRLLLFPLTPALAAFSQVNSKFSPAFGWIFENLGFFALPSWLIRPESYREIVDLADAEHGIVKLFDEGFERAALFPPRETFKQFWTKADGPTMD